jgi:hypothetical protein
VFSRRKEKKKRSLNAAREQNAKRARQAKKAAGVTEEQVEACGVQVSGRLRFGWSWLPLDDTESTFQRPLLLDSRRDFYSTLHSTLFLNLSEQ